MKGMEMAIAAVLAGAGCAALIAALRHGSRRQQAADRQLDALAATVKTLQARVAELSRRMPPASAGVARNSDPKPETLAVLTAAATAFLGKAAHIRSASLVPAAAENVSSWSQQGRVIVQTSHNLRSRE